MQGYLYRAVEQANEHAKKTVRLCVFCGSPPVDKNNEHVIPQWLLALTGDPKRTVSFGYNYRARGQSGGTHEFAFDQFRFPSCSKCNERFGKDLEGEAKRALVALLTRNRLGRSGVLTLLDWLDKVRTGLWLGFRYLNENPANIKPNFAIQDRIGMKDRMVAIYRFAPREEGLTFGGANTPLFNYAPSCFFLRVNQYALVNLSSDCLFSERAGLPYFVDATIDEQPDGRFRLIGKFVDGTGRIRSPLLDMPEFPKAHVRIFQAITQRGLDPEGDGSKQLPSSAGPILVEEKSRTTKMRPKYEILVPLSSTPGPILIGRIGVGVLQRQYKLQLRQPPTRTIDGKVRSMPLRGSALEMQRILIQRSIEED